MKTWTIGEVAAKSGVPTSTIRYYEQIELLPPSARVNGRRRYEETILQKLSIIRLAQQAGFTIAEIQSLLHDFPADAPPSTRWQLLARRKLVELDDLMRNLAAMKALLNQTLRCQCASLEDCATKDYEDMGNMEIILNC
jgi:MerR family transcriptional regulator, redox-sensitive transcriptional activator SoxR